MREFPVQVNSASNGSGAAAVPGAPAAALAQARAPFHGSCRRTKVNKGIFARPGERKASNFLRAEMLVLKIIGLYNYFVAQVFCFFFNPSTVVPIIMTLKFSQVTFE